jgi:hypothetical protein
MKIRQLLCEIATPNSIYDEIINNLITPNFHLKPALLSELSIGFLQNEKKVDEAIKNNYFVYYFIRSVKNQIHSNTSGFHKNTRIKDNIYFDNLEIPDESDIELKELKELKLLRIDKIYTTIQKSYFQEFIWHEYFTKGKTYRQISKENEGAFSHCLAFHEVSKIKKKIKEIIEDTK